MQHVRYDFAGTMPQDSPEALTDGTVRIPGFIARTGVQVYQYSDGTTVREYRPPEEVFAPASLASWDDLAVTDDHPAESVNPSNWSTLAKGHIDDPKKDGQFIAASVVVKDAATIAKVVAKQLVELSCGYFVEVDPTPGVTPEGEPYDQIQRNIVGNHVALGPAGWARAGDSARLYTGDSKDRVRTAVARQVMDSKDEGHGSNYLTSEEPKNMDSIRKDADKETPKAEQVQVVTLDQHIKVTAERDAAIARADKATEALKGAKVEADEQVADRVSIRVAAVKLDSKIEIFDGKGNLRSDRDVMLDAIKSVDPKFTGLRADGKPESDQYLRVRFDIACAEGKTVARDDNAEHTNKRALEADLETTVKNDGNKSDVDPIEKARLDFMKRTQTKSLQIAGSK